MDVCQIKIPGSISGDAFTPCHESELVFTARWFVEVTFAFITWQPALRLWEQQLHVIWGFVGLIEKLTGHLQLAWNSSEPPRPKQPT